MLEHRATEGKLPRVRPFLLDQKLRIVALVCSGQCVQKWAPARFRQQAVVELINTQVPGQVGERARLPGTTVQAARNSVAKR